MKGQLFGRFGCSMAALALGASLNAQRPSIPPPPPSGAPATQDQRSPVTVEGCLMREQDVPGRKPNLVERSSVMEDYILTHATVVKGSAPPASLANPTPGETPTGTSGTLSPMFDVKGLDRDKLKPLVGQRVQIDGTFGDVKRSPSAKPTEDLVDIRGVSIRPAASGQCPPK